jgi:hypothetical protein
MVEQTWTAKPSAENSMANKVLAVCLATTSVTNAWTLPLFDAAFNQEPELRNRLFCLLVNGLLDSGWEYRVRINGLKIDARKLQILAAPFYLEMFEKYLALAVDILEIFSRDEMIMLKDCRDQWLHGHWTEVHKENRTILYVEKGTIIRKKVSWVEFNQALERMFKPGVDHALTELRRRFCDYRTFFWAVDRPLSAPVTRDLIQKDLLLLDQFHHPKVVLKIPDPSFKPDPAKNDAYRSLSEFGRAVQEEERRAGKLDPRSLPHGHPR